MKFMKKAAAVTAAVTILAGVAVCDMPALNGSFSVVQAANELTLNKTSMSLGLGEGFKITANKSVKWRTSAPKILTVDQSGNVKAVGTGTAWITGKASDGKEKSCKITVKNAPSKVSLSKTSLTMGVGESFSLSAVLPDNTACAQRTFRTSNSSIVKMTKTNWTGDFTAVKEGTAWVTVRTYNGKEASCKITVKKAPSKVTIAKSSMTMGVGESFTLGCTIPDGTGAAKRTFRTSNSSIIKMTKTDWNGQFTAVKEGTAWVTVRTYNGKESSCKITVKKAPQSVGLNKGVLTLSIGEKASLSAVLPDNTGCATRTFRTSNSNIVKMTKTNWTGEFTAVGAGVAYVTVRTYNGKEKSCKVTVTNDIYTDSKTAEFKKKLKDEAAANGGKIDLTLWCSAMDYELEKQLVDEYKKLYSGSGYTLNVNIVPGLGENEAVGKVLYDKNAKVDVFNFPDDSINELVDMGSLAPVADSLKVPLKTANGSDVMNICTVNGKYYAFPKCDNGYYMYYDKRIYKNVSDTATLDGMIKKAGEYGKNVFFDIENSWYSASFLFASGVDIRYKNGVQTVTIDSKEGLAAAKAMCHVAEKSNNGFIGTRGTKYDNDAVKDGFKNGTLAAAVIGTWASNDIKNAIGESNVGVVKLPTALINGKQVQLHSFGGYKLVGAKSDSKYPLASQLLAYYLTNRQSQLKRYKALDYIPSAIDVQNNAAVKSDPLVSALKNQKPYTHAHNSTVSGKYFASSIGMFGGDIVKFKGEISDDELKAKLKEIQAQFD